MNNSNYWKAVATTYLMLLATTVLFFVCMCANGLRHMDEIYTKFGIAAGVLATGGILYYVSIKMETKELLWYILASLANIMIVAGAVAIVSPLIAVIASLFRGMDDFGEALFAWFCLSLLIIVCSSLAVASIKAAFQYLLKFQLFYVVLSLMIAVAGLFGIIPCINAAQSINGLVTFGCFLVLFGGGTLGGYVGKAPTVDDVAYDANGNPHYIVSRLSDNRVICTDGITWRKEADGHFSEL